MGMAPRIMARGAEGVLTRDRFLGLECVVKNRVRKGYRESELDAKLRTTRTRVEARLLHEAKRAGVRCPVVFSVSGSELIISFVKGKPLRELLEEKLECAAYLRESGEALARLHSAGIIHGDYTTANIIISQDKVWVIDFGLGEFTNDLEEKAVDVLLMKRSLSKEDYEHFLEGYRAYADSEKVLERLREIELRGRYVVRTMCCDFRRTSRGSTGARDGLRTG